jgi:hypothetical protein
MRVEEQELVRAVEHLGHHCLASLFLLVIASSLDLELGRRFAHLKQRVLRVEERELVGAAEQ